MVDPNISKPQRIWLVRSSITDGRNEEKSRLAHEQLSVVIADSLGMRSTSPAYLLSCTAPEQGCEIPALPEKTTEDIQAWAYDHITDDEMRRVQQHRQEECDLRREYLNTTFTDLILDLQDELNDLQQAQLIGDDEDAEERQKLEHRIEELKKRKATRLAELELMLKLHADLPNVVTSALVLPAPVATIEEVKSPKVGFPMRRDDEVEAIAMQVTMRYERSRGWTPHDVSKDGEHYDIRSESPTADKRFIEVKGRAQTGAVIITGPEVDKLRQLGDRAFLYIVTFCKNERPLLRIIQNPMSQLTTELLYRQVQFLLEEQDRSGKGEQVEVAP